MRVGGYLRRDILRLGWLFLVAVILAGAIYFVRRDSVSLFYQPRFDRLARAFEQWNSAEGVGSKNQLRDVSFDAMRAYVKQKTAWIIDARDPSEREAGTMPGAMGFSPEQILQEGKHAWERLAPFRERQVVVFCSGIHCDNADLVGYALVELGFTQVGIYRGGWEEWIENGGPVATEIAK